MQWLMMAVALGATSAARATERDSGAPRRIRSLALVPGQACPAAQTDEVVVCRPIEEPYRIPKALRRSQMAAATTSWVNRAATIDEIGRVAGGLPDTCSVVGTGGQTGCTQARLREWAAERRAAKPDSAP